MHFEQNDLDWRGFLVSHLASPVTPSQGNSHQKEEESAHKQKCLASWEMFGRSYYQHSPLIMTLQMLLNEKLLSQHPLLLLLIYNL